MDATVHDNGKVNIIGDIFQVCVCTKNTIDIADVYTFSDEKDPRAIRR